MADEKLIRYGNKTFPLGDLSLGQAKALMARHFPELADPKVDTRKDGQKTVYEFSKKAGRKGALKISPHTRARANLRRLRPTPVVPPAVVQACRTRRPDPALDIDALILALEAQAEAVRRAGDALMALAPTARAESDLL